MASLSQFDQKIHYSRHEFTPRSNITPFVCSTEDFEEEHVMLQRTFHELEQLCHERGMHFGPVYLPWTQKSKYAQDGLYLESCLNLIHSCCPYFICLIGERYGYHRDLRGKAHKITMYSPPFDDADWVGRNIYRAAGSGYHWLLEGNNQFKSVLDLQVQQAAFKCKAEHCRFYLRQPEHKFHRAEHLPMAQREAFYKQFEPESKYAEHRLKDLKIQLAKEGMHVSFFSDNVQLAKIVAQDWREVIDTVAPPLMSMPFITNEDDKYIYLDWLEHEAFAEQKRKEFMMKPEYEDMLQLITIFALKVLEHAGHHDTTFIAHDESSDDEDEDHTREPWWTILKKPRVQKRFTLTLSEDQTSSSKSILALVGDRGSGKTSLLAHWVERFQQENELIHFFSHYVGPVPLSCDITSILRRCLCFLCPDYYANLDQFDNCKGIQVLAQVFMSCVSHRPCIILLDGLDSLGKSSCIPATTSRDLRWLLDNIPPLVRLIVSTSKSDMTYELLASRSDVLLVDMPQLSSEPQKMKVLNHYLAPFHNSLPRQEMTELMANSLSQNPMYLAMVGQEVRQSMVNRSLKVWLERFSQSNGLRDLLVKLLDRWIECYSWTSDKVNKFLYLRKGNDVPRDQSGWVADFLRLLVMAETGLTKLEVLGCLERLGYVDDHAVSCEDIDLLLAAAGRLLVYLSPSGVLTFRSQHVKDLISNALISPDLPKLKTDYSALTLSVLPTKRRNEPVRPRRQLDNDIYHRLLADYFTNQEFTDRVYLELPWQLWGAKEFDRLVKVLGSTQMFASLYVNTRTRLFLIHWWTVLEEQGFHALESFQHMIKFQQPFTIPLVHLTMVHTQRSRLNRLISSDLATSDAELLSKQSLSPVSHSMSATAIQNSNIFIQIHTPTRIESVSEEQLQVQGISQSHMTTIQLDTNVQAVVFGAQKGEEVIKWVAELLIKLNHLKEALEILLGLYERLRKDIPLPPHRQVLLYEVMEKICNLNVLLDRVDEAEKAYRITIADMDTLLIEDQGLTMRALKVKGSLMASLVSLLIVQSKLTEAEQLIMNVRRIMQRTHNIVGLAQNMYHTAVLRMEQQRFEEAEHFLLQAIKGFQMWYGKHHYKVADVMHEYAVLLTTENNKTRYNLKEAENFYREALAMRKITFGKSHLIVSETLFCLGKLLSQYEDPPHQIEGVELIVQALDIRTTLSGPAHPATLQISRILQNLQFDLHFNKTNQVKAPEHRTPSVWLEIKRLKYLDEVSKKLQQSNAPRSKIEASHILGEARHQQEQKELEAQEEAMRALEETGKRPITAESGYSYQSLGSQHLTGWQKQLAQELHLSPLTDSPILGSGRSPQTLTPDQNEDYKKMVQLIHSLPATPNPITIPRRADRHSLFYHERCAAPYIQQRSMLAGPHSDLSSLLHPLPRHTPGKQIQHQTAWFHVPGRYVTNVSPVPPKRGQKRPVSMAQKRLMDQLRRQSFSSTRTL